jgi:hypothetical protein
LPLEERHHELDDRNRARDADDGERVGGENRDQLLERGGARGVGLWVSIAALARSASTWRCAIASERRRSVTRRASARCRDRARSTAADLLSFESRSRYLIGIRIATGARVIQSPTDSSDARG